jgi:TatD DNase family protein
MLIDSHCHCNALSRSIRDSLFSSVPEDYRFIDSSIDIETTRVSLELSKKYPFLYTSLGFHPLGARTSPEGAVKEYRRFLDRGAKVVAVGEIGFDYKAELSFAEQEHVFRMFLSLAKERDVAVVLHNRFDPSRDEGEFSIQGGFARLFGILDEYFPSYAKVVFHCFSYSQDLLSLIIERGGFASFSLNILRSNEKIIASLKNCPLSNMLLETDSPYMKIKDRHSTPLDIDRVYARTSLVKDIDESRLKEAVLSNARSVFSLDF